MAKILVTGGGGYIGTHTLVDLVEHGFEVVSADNFIRTDARMLAGVERILGKAVVNYDIDLTDAAATRRIFTENPDIAGVIHFAAVKSVEESVKEPLLYYRNNLNILTNVLECVAEFGVGSFIFSSSCAVYGNVAHLPVTEATPMQEAESPYAHTKQIGEGMIRHFAKVHPKTRCILLRYFNPAGAHESAHIGEMPMGVVTYLVPIVMEVATGKRAQLTIYGNDYDTRDGTCIRDFIHVSDLANAHTKALEYLQAGKNETNCEVFNLGIGQGVTVLEAIEAFERVAKQPLNYQLGERRAGDVVAIYANYTRAAERLAWQPTRTIDDIMRTAWAWENNRQVAIATYPLPAVR